MEADTWDPSVTKSYAAIISLWRKGSWAPDWTRPWHLCHISVDRKKYIYTPVAFRRFTMLRVILSTTTSWEIGHVIESPQVTGILIVLVSVPAISAAVSAATALPTLFNFPGKPLKLISWNHTWLTHGCGKIFGTHLGDLGTRSLSYRSGTQFSLSPR